MNRGCTVTHVNMYLKSKLNHCCYLTVTVKLLLSVIYWRSGEWVTPLYSRVTDPHRGEAGRAGPQLAPRVLLKYIFCTETQKCSVHFSNNADVAHVKSSRRGMSDASLSYECANRWRQGNLKRKKGRNIVIRPHLPVLS